MNFLLANGLPVTLMVGAVSTVNGFSSEGLENGPVPGTSVNAGEIITVIVEVIVK